ncbi:conserved hypothetical protein [Leishmania braziliensis MHOM/BR/75/M2904]|uniref:Leucine-rich repeat protein n=2 Tax=Leishmania braziliensis TaxID=5660 RepID=A4H779_LEIBR|nr:conserved hypothetical protein [Leishmania braziliensis MHOM/BR/75/M2904]CAJ2468711.1 unnamed protein product [Leishmania braziliensis]CAM45635.1 conserved hypothetical protein [Leishmania braziliensis MHOM/BR/75/M2904]SYZ63895.1 Leucine_Rich_repeat/Leucine_Rich_repeats_(2_copies)/Leucine_Rich_Repeat [Leishmania braziliensis MHOM/BR/75/M2904]
MFTCEDEEPLDLTARGGGFGHTGVASLDTIIQSLNKRYEVYQRRRTAMTPFGTPGDPFIPAPPTPHPILGDSKMASGVSMNTGGVGGGGGVAAPQSSESPKESIIVPRAHPAPYWEERELYIVAEDLCCCLNGGINYRLLCEQNQRALEVLLTLVREDVQLCMSSELVLLPGGTVRPFLAKLKELLTESKRLLGEAGVSVPPRLANMIEQLPSSGGGASHASLHAGHNSAAVASAHRGGAPLSTTSTALHPGRSTLSASIMANGRLTGTSGGGGHAPGSAAAGGSIFEAAGSRSNHSGNLPSQYTQSHHSAPPHRSSPSAGLHGDSIRDGGVEGGNVAAAERRPSPAPPSRPHLVSPDNGYLHLGNPGSTNGNGLLRQPQPPVVSSFRHLSSAGACRNTPGLATTMDSLPVGCSGAGGEGASGVDVRSSHESGCSILRSGSGCLNSWLPGADLAPITKRKASPIATDGRPPQRHAPPQPATTPMKQCAATESTSPVPTTLLSTGDVPGVHGHSHGVVSDSLVDSNSEAQVNTDVLAVKIPGEDAHDVLAAPAPGRRRRRQLEDLYGEFYAMDGMALLTDALGVVLTREYDQAASQQGEDAFAAFQRDVYAKVMPVLQSCESLQGCITDLEPLRSSYLASCLAHRVRPSGAVLERLKGIDEDRSVETLLLGGLHLGNRGLVALAESVLPRLYRLRRLDLSDNNVSDSALEPLLRSIRYHPSLEHLNLSHNPLTDGALPLLLRIAQTLPRLSELLLRSCAMKPAALQMVETEVTTPSTHAIPGEAGGLSLQPLTRVGSATVSATRTAAASALQPRPPSSLPRLTLPRGERRWSPMSMGRAESVPSGSSKGIAQSEKALKERLPIGMKVALEPILPALATLSPNSLSDRSPPGRKDGAGDDK